jgi:hypothetical protein
MFENHGMTNTSLITNAVLDQCTDNSPQLIVGYLGTKPSSASATVEYTPDPQVILANGDFLLTYVENFEGVILSSTQAAGGVVRIIASVDQGVTWKTWNTGTAQWDTVDPDVAVDVKTYGMTAATLNSLVRANWSALLGESETIRFGYYLEKAAFSDTAETDAMSLVLDLIGSWDMAVRGTDWAYSFPRSDKFRIKFFADGTYKVNY